MKQLNFSKKEQLFNEKYQLEDIQPKLFQKSVLTSDDRSLDLSGKITTTSREVVKRFIRNPYAMIGFAIVLAIILAALIVTFTSPFSPADPISTAQQSIIAFLPPRTFGDYTYQNLSNFDLLGLQKDGFSFGDGLAGPKYIHIERTNPDGTFYVYWSPWLYMDSLIGPNTHLSGLAGTDSVGQDIWIRTWAGLLNSIKLALLVAFSEIIIGVPIGAYIGFHAGGKLDLFAMRFIGVITSVPQIIWYIVLTFILPVSLGFWSLYISFTVVGFFIPLSFARLYVLKIKNLEYLTAAQAIGVSKSGVIFKHALPNVIGKLTAIFTRRVPIIILGETTLAFLGLIPNPGSASLGALITDAKNYPSFWWYLLLPAGLLALITIGLQAMSSGLHDAFDPRTKGTNE